MESDEYLSSAFALFEKRLNELEKLVKKRSSSWLIHIKEQAIP